MGVHFSHDRPLETTSNWTRTVVDKPLNYQYRSVTDINPTREFLGTRVTVPQKESDNLLRSVIYVHNSL